MRAFVSDVVLSIRIPLLKGWIENCRKKLSEGYVVPREIPPYSRLVNMLRDQIADFDFTSGKGFAGEYSAKLPELFRAALEFCPEDANSEALDNISKIILCIEHEIFIFDQIAKATFAKIDGLPVDVIEHICKFVDSH
jgi:hypothetical protein